MTTTDCCAPGGLLEVLARVNAGQPGPITFALPGSPPWVIDVSGVTLTTPVVIDGTSESVNGVPQVQIHAAITFAAPGCTVQGLDVDQVQVQAGADSATIRRNYLALLQLESTHAAVRDNFISGDVFIGEEAGKPPAAHNVLQGNRIGTNAAGTAAPGSGGLVEVKAPDTLIGGTGPGDGNLIARAVELYPGISGIDGSVVAGNLIGTDVTGTTAITAGHVAILQRGTNAVVGPGNVIVGGVEIDTGSGNTVKGNLIGTDITGTKALVTRLAAHSGIGVDVVFGSNNTIGGTTTADRNVIAGFTAFVDQNNITVPGYGIEIGSGAATHDNRVLGNFIGTDVTGTRPLPNQYGISVDFAAATTIGAPGAGNVISGNTADGIQIHGSGAGNTIQGNFVGTDLTGTTALGNGGTGVRIEAATGVLIGGTDPGTGNVIDFNKEDGVAASGNGITIAGNSIDQNAAQGIRRLSGTIAPPTLSSYVGGASSTFVGRATGPAGQSLTVEFFANPAGDGQGRTPCGRRTYPADATGKISFAETFACPVADPSEAASGTVTLTDADGNTSEFSAPGGATGTSTTTTTTLPLDPLAAVRLAVTRVEGTLNAPPQPECTSRCRCAALATAIQRVSSRLDKAESATKRARCKRPLNAAQRITQGFRKHLASLIKRGCLAPQSRGPILAQQAADLRDRIEALRQSTYCWR